MTEYPQSSLQLLQLLLVPAQLDPPLPLMGMMKSNG